MTLVIIETPTVAILDVRPDDELPYGHSDFYMMAS